MIEDKEERLWYWNSECEMKKDVLGNVVKEVYQIVLKKDYKKENIWLWGLTEK